MGQYLLCSTQAKHPYFEKQLGLRINTAEELCYYIYNNLELLDDGFLDNALFDFLQETGFGGTVDRIHRLSDSGPRLAQALSMILRDVGYYQEGDLTQYWDRVSAIRRLSPPERTFKRADLLFTCGRFEGAIKEYSTVLLESRQNRVTSAFYVSVLRHMGSAYMQLGLSAEALECFSAAYQETKDSDILRQIYFVCLLCDCPFSPELETVSKDELNRWHQEYLDAETRNQVLVASDMERLFAAEGAGAFEDAKQAYLDHEKRHFRRMIRDGL